MTDLNRLIEQLGKLGTEQVNPETMDIDRLSPLEIVRKINDQDRQVAGVVEKALEPIARAAETYALTLRNGGRVFYIGAGTSGRLGVLDAAECPPTFGTDPEQIVGVVSGGYATLVLSMEGVEDDVRAAVKDLQKHRLSEKDFVLGLAASTRTPYTLSGLRYAKSLGGATALIVCNQVAELEAEPDILIELPVGPEVIAGSTRMKSGTAQKMALNMISTGAMVLLGKTFGNIMIDLQCRSEKLAARSRKIVMDLLELPFDKADALLKEAGGSVKLALVMHWHDCDRDRAGELLEQVDGFLSRLNTP